MQIGRLNRLGTVVYWMRDGQGTTEVRATDANANGLGRSWALPLLEQSS